MQTPKRADTRVTVYIDEHVFRRFKAACAFEGVTMSDVCQTMMEDHADDVERRNAQDEGAPSKGASSEGGTTPCT